MVEELAYSIHLGSDKNRTNRAKEIAKENPSGETSFSNNGIQNAKQLSKVNKHNLRDYDKRKDDIFVVYGSNDLYQDTKDLYFQEFEESRIEYNNKQTRDDRKIDNYFKHISDSKLWDLACELVIELGDMDFWQDKDKNYRMKMIDVYNEQIKDLKRIVPAFKVANAVIHFDETSPHLHVVGIGVTDNNKKGMKKQVSKSKIFTKQSLSKLQDEMRKCCIKSYNKFYEKEATLKHKQKGRNIDVNVKDMSNYKTFKKEYNKNRQAINEVFNNSKTIDKFSNEIDKVLSDLKPTKLNKNNYVISNEDIAKIKDYTKNVKYTNKTFKKVNRLNDIADNFEKDYSKLYTEKSSLEYQLELKDEDIKKLEKKIEKQEDKITNLSDENKTLKLELHKFKTFWRNLMHHFQDKIAISKDDNYKKVADNLYEDGIFDENEKEIVNNPLRKVKTKEELEKLRKERNNDVKF